MSDQIKMSNHLVPFFLLLGFSNLAVAADQQIQLAPIVKEGSVSDVLMEDPVLPAKRGKPSGASASGGLEHSITMQLPISVTDTGQPGNLAQVRGLGRSSDETDVQTLGIPLNGPQGLGFDFSTFPEFFWGDFQYQIGPSLGAFDPSGVSGTLTLHPWTELALTGEGNEISGRQTLFHSSGGVEQVSIAGRKKDVAAALIGHSTGRVEGTTGSFSGQQSFGAHRLQVHFIGTDLNAGSRQARYSNLDQKLTTRVIPVVSGDFVFSKNVLWKTTAFNDAQTVRSVGSTGYSTVTTVSQVGTENVVLVHDWKLGFSARHVAYDTSSFEPYSQNVYNAQAGRAFEAGRLLIEPTLRATTVTRFDVEPEGSLGIRYQTGQDGALFSRTTYSHKFPTMADRIYFYPSFAPYKGFRGNPDLKPEQDLTEIVGGEYKSPNHFWEADLQLYNQIRWDAQVKVAYDSSYDWIANSGRAQIHAAILTGTLHPASWLDLSDGLTYTYSQVDATGLRFAYMPTWINVASARFHPKGDSPRWNFGLFGRFATSSLASNDDATQTVPGYAFFDARFQWRALEKGFRSLSLTLGVENIANREIEIIQQNPITERTYSVGVTAQL